MIETGQKWRDCDSRSYYDALPDGSHPVPPDYVGRLSVRPRYVEVIGFEGDHVIVKNLHNERISRVRKDFFYESDTNAHGRPRRQGFVRCHDIAATTFCPICAPKRPTA